MQLCVRVCVCVTLSGSSFACRKPLCLKPAATDWDLKATLLGLTLKFHHPEQFYEYHFAILNVYYRPNVLNCVVRTSSSLWSELP